MSKKGDTEGKTRDLKLTDLAYVAGFLDGDGCVMLQMIPRKGYVLGYQLRASIVFYQKTQHKSFLVWLKEQFEDGYTRDRNDDMSEYTIVGIQPVVRILSLLQPYLRLKKRQADEALSILSRLSKRNVGISAETLLSLAERTDVFAALNYSKRRINTSAKVKDFLLFHNLLIP